MSPLSALSTVQPALDGLYAITPDTPDSDWLLPRVAAVLAGGAGIVQYRNKSDDAGLRLEQATAIQALCHDHRALFIVNDDVALAAKLGADGVHIGRSDAAIAVARGTLGPQAIIGATCHDQPVLASKALAAGANYVGVGAVFASGTKPEAVAAPLELCAHLAMLGIPAAAIGGITAGNAARVWQTGVDMLAVIGGLFNAADPAGAARAILAARRHAVG